MLQAADERVDRLVQALLSLDRLGVEGLLASPASPAPAVQRAETLIVPALERIGKWWEEGRVALSQVYMSSRLCEEVMLARQPALPPGQAAPSTMAIAVLEDYHLLGSRLVYSVLRASGFELLSYGRQDMQGLVGRVKTDGIKTLLVSVLMLHSALRIRELRARLNNADCPVRLVVGGAPFRLDPELWREVGADATAPDAAGAPAALRNLIGGVAA